VLLGERGLEGLDERAPVVGELRANDPTITGATLPNDEAGAFQPIEESSRVGEVMGEMVADLLTRETITTQVERAEHVELLCSRAAFLEETSEQEREVLVSSTQAQVGFT
jgi:hypothetical protein